MAIRVLFLFLPGIISTTIIDLLTSHRKRTSYQFILHSYLLGVFSYGILILIVFINNKIVLAMKRIPSWEITFLNSLLDSKEKINVYEVFLASLVGIFLAVLLVLVINKKYLYKAANAISISNKHGEDDVWDFLFNSNDIEWITIRDSNTSLIYQGAVSSFSQKDDKREIVLSQVKVYRDENNGDTRELYERDFMYFSFDVNSNILIEVG